MTVRDLAGPGLPTGQLESAVHPDMEVGRFEFQTVCHQIRETVLSAQSRVLPIPSELYPRGQLESLCHFAWSKGPHLLRSKQ